MPTRCAQALALAALLLAAPATAASQEDEQQTMPRAIARSAIAFMVHTGNLEGWSRGWGTFTGRSRDVRWHLVDPEDVGRVRADNFYRRTGYISEGGAQAHVSLCGDRQVVRAVAFHASWYGRQAATPETIAAAFAAEGATLTLRRRESRPWVREGDPHYGMEQRSPYASMQLQSEEHLVEARDRRPALLFIHEDCTPPGTRHATNCWVNVRLVLRAEFTPATAQEGELCRNPGRGG